LIVYKSSNMENGGRYAQNMVLGRWLLELQKFMLDHL
jgi:hypothetical protein